MRSEKKQTVRCCSESLLVAGRNLHRLSKKENQCGSSLLLMLHELFTGLPFVARAAHRRQSQSMLQVLGESEGTLHLSDGSPCFDSAEMQAAKLQMIPVNVLFSSKPIVPKKNQQTNPLAVFCLIRPAGTSFTFSASLLKGFSPN